MVIAAGLLSTACERGHRGMDTRIVVDIAFVVLGATLAVSSISFALLMLGYP